VIRPADANETAQAWRDVVEHDGPSALVLSRQNVEVVTDGSAVADGAGVVRDVEGTADLVIVGTGSEVALCVHAAEALAEEGVNARVVSLPSWDRFEQQDDRLKATVFPSGVPVLSVEAAVRFGWDRYADDSVSIERFGVSAPGSVVLEKLGFNVDHVVERAHALLDRRRHR
jgi:transketolase